MERTRGTLPGPSEHSDRLFEQWFLNTLCCLPEGSPARSVCSIQLSVITCVPTVLDNVSKDKRGGKRKREGEQTRAQGGQADKVTTDYTLAKTGGRGELTKGGDEGREFWDQSFFFPP